MPGVGGDENHKLAAILGVIAALLLCTAATINQGLVPQLIDIVNGDGDNEKVAQVRPESTQVPAPTSAPSPTRAPTRKPTAEPPPTAMPSRDTQSPTPPVSPSCRPLNGSDGTQLHGTETYIEGGSYIHVSFFFADGDQERNVILPTADAQGGRYNLTQAIKGRMWVYSEGCSYQRVYNEVLGHIERALDKNYNVFPEPVDWKEAEVFIPAGSG